MTVFDSSRLKMWEWKLRVRQKIKGWKTGPDPRMQSVRADVAPVPLPDELHQTSCLIFAHWPLCGNMTSSTKPTYSVH